jgi:hypothetical protein
MSYDFFNNFHLINKLILCMMLRSDSTGLLTNEGGAKVRNL